MIPTFGLSVFVFVIVLWWFGVVCTVVCGVFTVCVVLCKVGVWVHCVV